MASLKQTDSKSLEAETNTNQSKNETQSSEEEFYPLSFFKNHKFETPTKRISIHSHIGEFLTSPTYTKLIKFLQDLSESVKSTKISDLDQSSVSSTTSKFVSMLDCIEAWVDEVEPLQIQSRYGNKAYRIWQEKLHHGSKALLIKLLPDSWTKKQNENDNEEKDSTSQKPILDAIVCELNGYLLGSFGDTTRIDYGTGHELTFICLILILKELRIFRQQDYQAIVLLIFVKYIHLMRKIQTKYGLEPAGTKGVWGLDDYQFLPFYFGASQLIDHGSIKPNDILKKEILSKWSKDYLYLSCIQFILEMKTGPFPEHSPLLFDISGVPLWYKVRNGLLKMYQDDVLKKLPVVQHFLFGSILSINLPPINQNSQGNDEKAEILKRKQALIAKLNAKNPNMNKPNVRPQNTNETSPDQVTVVTKAPWAK